MKNSSLFFIFFLGFSFVANAQFFDKNYIYGNVGISGGNYYGADVGINDIYKQKYIVHLGIYSLFTEAIEKPSDYSAGSGIFGSGDSNITDKYNMPHLTAGYVRKFNENSNFRLILQGGLGLQFREYATNFQDYENTGGFGGFNFGTSPSHTYDFEKDVSLAIIINPRVEYTLSHVYGFAVSPLLIINNKKTFYGISIINIIGKIREKKNKPEEE